MSNYQPDQLIQSKPEKPIARLVFAHGAGAGMDSDFMTEIDGLLTARGISVVRFNFNYMIKMQTEGKRRPPDRMPALLTRYREVLDTFSDDLPLFIGGKSMGGRASTLLMAEDDAPEQVSGTIVAGYPFHAPGKTEKLRIDHFADIKCPALILQGERDSMGNQSLVSELSLPAAVNIHYLPDGDHSLKPRKASGYSYQSHMEKAADEAVAFIQRQIMNES